MWLLFIMPGFGFSRPSSHPHNVICVGADYRLVKSTETKQSVTCYYMCWRQAREQCRQLRSFEFVDYECIRFEHIIFPSSKPAFLGRNRNVFLALFAILGFPVWVWAEVIHVAISPSNSYQASTKCLVMSLVLHAQGWKATTLFLGS